MVDLIGEPGLSIEELQDQHAVWLAYNFPKTESWEALAGLMEETGELAHAHLKGFRGIRGMTTPKAIQDAKADAVGDIFIYLLSYCNTNDLSLERCIKNAWKIVGVRDWQSNPEDGTT